MQTCTMLELEKEADRKEARLRVKWVDLKLVLTEWLAQSTEELPIEGDYRAIKCIIDGICGLEKLIGVDKGKVNTEEKLISTKQHTDRLVKRFDALSHTSKKVKKKATPKPPSE